MAVFCLSTLIVGCDKKCTPHADENADLTCDNCGEALEAPACKPHVDENKDYVCDNCPETFIAPCETHKDENADKHCDVCGLAVITIIQNVEPTPEERVDMVVNPLPENGNINDYTSFFDNTTVISKVETTFSGNVVAGNNHGYTYLTVPTKTIVGDDEVTYNTHYIINLETGAIVFEVSDINSANTLSFLKDNVQINLHDYFFSLRESYPVLDPVTGVFTTYTNYKFYAYDGTTVLFDAAAAFEDLSIWGGYDEYLLNDVHYFVFDETVYAFEAGTLDLLYTCNKIELVHRPEFDATTDKYGFVYMDNNLFVYDLSQWVECVYSYQIPSFYENAELFLIDNSRVLLQASVKLLNNSVSYDYINNGDKYDLVYVVIDPTAKTNTEVEFGYYINDAEDWSEGEKTLNYIEAYPIVNDRIDYNNLLTLITDKDLKITYATAKDNFYFVNETTLLVYEEISLGLTVKKLVNAADGKLIAYVPDSAIVYDEYIYYDHTFYDFTMTAILDLEKEGFNIPGTYQINDRYALLTKVIPAPTIENPLETVVEHYIFTANGATKLDIPNFNSFVGDIREYGFIASRNVAAINEFGNPVLNTVYTLYNAEGKEIFTSENYLYQSQISFGGTYVFTDNNNNIYLVK